MDEIKAKQQVVEKIKEAGKILVTVSDSPTVDALSAALGLTLLLEKQEKYATAIFSGETPPAIAFLDPNKTFDDTTDSLRDFIIALNKEKADHLRYKVEGESVKIFITPYKTTISQDDLDFSQGDYNVELVIALGVDNQDHLDKALENHGQILHDAAIITMTTGSTTSDLGGIDWHEANSSSLSEMVAGLAEALKEDKKKSLFDETIATALLTGIVAETDRFSNEHTTSKVMTVAASLMAAGADQQLIATELQQSHSIDGAEDQTNESNDDDSTPSESHDEDGSLEVKKDPTKLSIEHEETLAELDERVMGEEKAQEKIEDEIDAIQEEAEIEAAKQEAAVIKEATPKLEQTTVVPEQPQAGAVHGYASEEDEVDEPTFGGVLNATADQAEDDARRIEEQDQNRTILSHAYIGDTPAASSDAPADLLGSAPSGFPGAPAVVPGSVGFEDISSTEPVHAAYAVEDDTPTSPEPTTLSGIGGERVIQPIETPIVTPAEAYAAPAPAGPVDLGLPLPPPVPDFSQGLGAAFPPAPAPTPIGVASIEQPAILGDILAPAPVETPATPVNPTPPAPGQFQIPGQN